MAGLRIAIVGLNFGGAMLPLYQRHPGVTEVAVCDPRPAALASARDDHGVARCFGRYEDVLADPAIDAVHLATPIPFHAPQAIAALKAGKHVAVSVPAATSIEDLHAIIAAERASGKVYSMGETAAFSADYLYARDLHRAGGFGRIQLLRGVHFQDLEGLHEFWRGLPPLWYATHALAPLLLLTGTTVRDVVCIGSGSMRRELAERHGNPFPCATALMRLVGHEAMAEISRTLFETAVECEESISIYGSRRSLLPGRGDGEAHRLVTMGEWQAGQRGSTVTAEHVVLPERLDLLPADFASAIVSTWPDRHSGPRIGHGGSHPHVVHDFVDAIVRGRPPVIDATRAAEICAPGIIAHQSAMREGERLAVPSFR